MGINERLGWREASECLQRERKIEWVKNDFCHLRWDKGNIYMEEMKIENK